MALAATLRIRAQQQGSIRGSLTQKGREGLIAVLESSHEVAVSSDPVTGLANGRAQHRPFVVVKEIDQATPALYQAMLNRELLTEFELHYWVRGSARAGRAGSETMRYRVRLTNAHIESMRFVQADVLDPALEAFPEAEELSVSYQHIEWAWTDPPSVASADWLAASRDAMAVPVQEAAAAGKKAVRRRRQAT